MFYNIILLINDKIKNKRILIPYKKYKYYFLILNKISP